MKINVVVKKVNGKKVYLTPSPVNEGYMELTEEEVQTGIAAGTLQYYTPDPWLVEAVRRQRKDDGN